MTVLELDAPMDRRSARPTVELAPTRRRRRRPAHGRGRAIAPGLRPSTGLAGAVPGDAAAVGSRACRPRVGAVDDTSVGLHRRSSAWQLTDRGIALVLVVAAMVTVAALAVVVPTALRVTGNDYQPLGTSQAAGPIGR